MPTAAPPRKKRDTMRESREYELNLSDYSRIVIKQKWIVLFVFLLVYIGSVVFTNLREPVYQASSTVRIVQENTVVSGFSPFTYPTFNTDVMASQAKVITSQAVIEKVVFDLGLVNEKSKSEEIQQRVAEIQGSVSTRREEATDLIHIIVNHSNAEMAAKIANLTALEYKKVNLLEKNKKARNLREFVERQLELSRNQIKSLENKLRELNEKGAAGGVSMALQNQLGALEMERLTLLQKYTEKHPDVIRIEDQIESLQAQLKETPSDQVDFASLKREMQVSERTYRMLKDKFEDARIAEAEEIGNVSIVNMAATPGSPISPNRRMNKLVGIFLGLVLGLFAAFLIESMDTSIGTIEDLENLIKIPVMGVLPYLFEGKESKWHMLKRFGRLPNKPARPEELLIARLDPKSTMSEAYRILRTHISFTEQVEGKGKVLIITSTGPQEGKSVTCSNLAISLSQSGKRVVLVDADMRRSSVHHFFGLKRAPGLSDILVGTSKIEESVKTLTDILMGGLSFDQSLKTAGLDHLSIITSGSKTPSPAELLSNPRLSEMIERLKVEYDYIIFDCPPILPVTDTMIIGKFADSVFMVYQAGRTARRALLRARNELEIGGISVKGIILNQANPDVKLGSTYYYKYTSYSATDEST